MPMIFLVALMLGAFGAPLECIPMLVGEVEALVCYPVRMAREEEEEERFATKIFLPY